jgi:hypothetical protein
LKYDEAFALTGRHSPLNHNPGRCPGLRASALSGRLAANTMSGSFCPLPFPSAGDRWFRACGAYGLKILSDIRAEVLVCELNLLSLGKALLQSLFLILAVAAYADYTAAIGYNLSILHGCT